MKKLIAGIGMMLTGFLGIAILCAGAMSSQYIVKGSKNNLKAVWEMLGVTPIANMFVWIAVLGVIFCILGILDKRK